MGVNATLQDSIIFFENTPIFLFESNACQSANHYSVSVGNVSIEDWHSNINFPNDRIYIDFLNYFSTSVFRGLTI